MRDIKEIIGYLRAYDGPELKFMEVCGTHTAAIFKSGIRSLISPKIHLISGPGCPVCVTPTAYIDRLLEYGRRENHVICSFGDMLKVPGSGCSLSEAKGEGVNVRMIYSPPDVADMAEKERDKTFVMAAVGFETTAPAYALMLKEAKGRGIDNIRLVTALKRVIPALSWICENEEGIDGFICPGHVSTIIGSDIYAPLAERYKKPFVVAGFEAEHLLAAIYDLVRCAEKGEARADNLYTSGVRSEGNLKALALIDEYFETGDAVWRGLGRIPESGYYLREEFAGFDVGSRGLDSDSELPEACRCADVIVGRISPDMCPMFGNACRPETPYGPCMVSAEGACGIWFRNSKGTGKQI